MDRLKMVDLGGYVIILIETQDKKVKLYSKMMSTNTERHLSLYQLSPLQGCTLRVGS